MAAVRSLYLATPAGTCFGVLHEASGGPAVLICPPWGWEEVASYRSRKRWAEALAEAGHPVLRLDLPGNGQSEGDSRGPAMVRRWPDAIAAAAAWLAEETGSPVAALGLGTGGVLASEAIARGAQIERLMLWGAPISGRAAARKIRAFGMIQEWEPEEADWVEAGGFALDLTAMEELEAISSAPATELPEEQVLALPERGWAAMIGHPQESKLSEDAVVAAERWLSTQLPGHRTGDGAARRVPAEERVEMLVDTDGGEIRERTWSAELGFGRAHGILAEPGIAVEDETCGLFLNAGAVRSIGPNRIWVDVARAWAARGIPSLRLDLEGIGEAEGDERELESVVDFYVPKYVDQVAEAIEALAATGLGTQFKLVGLCAGGYWAYQAALRDRRISHLFLFNPGGLAWSPRADAEVGPAGLPAWSERVPDGSELDSLRDQGTRLTVAFSGDEPLRDAMEDAGIFADSRRWPNLSVDELPGSDHTLRPLPAQSAAKTLLLGDFDAEPPKARDRDGGDRQPKPKDLAGGR